jgi:hypothetical protein
MEFEGFGKIPRLKRGCVITEKIDGTNGQIAISDEGAMFVGSRNRWITPEMDNARFARWAHENKEELLTLGPGRHYGEWWGQGIQRRYGMDRKQFSLFNTSRWNSETVPSCCGVVPVLYAGEFTTDAIDSCLEQLAFGGSVAAPGFADPEGVVVYLQGARQYMKVTIKGDGVPKTLNQKENK